MVKTRAEKMHIFDGGWLEPLIDAEVQLRLSHREVGSPVVMMLTSRQRGEAGDTDSCLLPVHVNKFAL